MSVNDEALGPQSDSFWEIDGYKAAVRRQEDGSKLCTELTSLIQERADIEKNYAKSLTTWNKKWMTAIEKGPEYGTTQAAWKGVLVESEGISAIHSEIRDQLLNEVCQKIKEWKNSNFKKAVVGPCKETKQLEEEFKKAQKPWAKKYSKVKEARKSYHNACKMEKSYTNQENNARADSGMSADQLKKIQDKAEKCRKEVDGTQQKYQSALTDLNSYNPKYMEDMNMVFEKSDNNEEKRLVFFKEMLFGIHKCLDISQNVKIPQIYSQLHYTIDQADYQKDLKWWSQSHGKDMGMNWPQFEEYQEGHHAISRKEKAKSTHIGGNEGITLTGLRTDNAQPPPSYNTVAANGSTGSGVTPPQASPNLQRLPSYDHALNPFDGEETTNTVDLSMLEGDETTPSEKQATNAAPKTDPSEKQQTNAAPKTPPSERTAPIRPPVTHSTPAVVSADENQNQNPFGDDEFDDDEQIDTRNGVPVRAIYDYTGQEDDELTFKEGEVFLKLKDKDSQGWCTGMKDGTVGLYPDNYATPV